MSVSEHIAPIPWLPQIRAAPMTPVLLSLLIAASLLSLAVGQLQISLAQCVGILFYEILGINIGVEYDTVQASVLLSLRLPRVILALLVGSALSVSGATLQGVFRNPLADPSLLGVSSGAALSVSIALVFGGSLIYASPLLLPIVALCGGLGVTIIVWRLSSRDGQVSVLTMLLAGIAINALCGAGIGLCIYAADDSQLRDLSFWMLGSLNGATWTLVLSAAPFILSALILLPRFACGLDAMLLGEREATYLGIDVQRVRRWAVLAIAIAVGAAVAVSGIIGFIGLVVPHILRLSMGPSHQRLLPACMILGALALVCADIIARVAIPPTDLPIGIVTAFIGSPIFIWLLVSNREGSPSD